MASFASVSAVSSPPVKIVLKGGTNIPLNDRFTKMIKERSKEASQSKGGAGPSAAQQYTASTKNKRLAQQMSKRPAVAAALGLGGNQVVHRAQTRQPAAVASGVNLKQRLGRSNIRGRLGAVPSARGRLGPVVSAPVRRGRGFARGQQSTTFTRGQVRGRVGTQSTRGRGSFRGRGITRGGQSRGQGRGRGARGRGQQVSRGRGRGGKPVSREKLDTELDAYMSHTKGSLDAELDAYMAEASTN